MGMRAGSNEEPAWVSSSLGEEENPGKRAWRDISCKRFEFTSGAGAWLGKKKIRSDYGLTALLIHHEKWTSSSSPFSILSPEGTDRMGRGMDTTSTVLYPRQLYNLNMYCKFLLISKYLLF